MNSPRTVTCPDCGQERIIRYYSKTDRCLHCESSRRSHVLSEEQLTDRVTEDDAGCWLWQGVLRKGYGVVKSRGRQYAAHRVAYSLFVGVIPDRAHVHHLCGIARCINPYHLVLVGHLDHPTVEAQLRARSGFRPARTRRPRRKQ